MRSRARLSLLAWGIVCIAGVGGASAQLCFQAGKAPLQENFNTLAVSGTSNQVVPTGFAYNESPGNITYAADSGIATDGNTYSYGTGTNNERALASWIPRACTASSAPASPTRAEI